MSACTIAAQLGQGKKFPTVEIDGLNAQVLSNKNFDSNPIPQLEIYKCHSEKEIEKLKRKYQID